MISLSTFEIQRLETYREVIQIEKKIEANFGSNTAHGTNWTKTKGKYSKVFWCARLVLFY